LPTESVLGEALRNVYVWPDVHRFLVEIAAGSRRVGSTGQSVYGVEMQAEHEARKEGVRRVGERHILAALLQGAGAEIASLGVKLDKLQEVVLERELGPGFAQAEIE